MLRCPIFDAIVVDDRKQNGGKSSEKCIEMTRDLREKKKIIRPEENESKQKAESGNDEKRREAERSEK